MSTVLLAGATGLVGGYCLDRLIGEATVGRIIVLTRRPFVEEAYPGEEKIEECVVDFDRLASYSECFAADAVICALGTTIRKAGSKERFRRVDHDYPLEIAELALRGGASRYLLVSAVGADPGSMFFYNRVKGEVERDVRALPIPSLTIVRPSLLAGDRDEFRLGEQLAYRLRFLIPEKYKPVHADAVAAVLVNEVRRAASGIRLIESHEIRALGPSDP